MNRPYTTNADSYANHVNELMKKDKRIADLEAYLKVLRDASREYMSQFGQALDAHGIPYGFSQAKADANLRMALNTEQP